jgi:hypothetical protein
MSEEALQEQRDFEAACRASMLQDQDADYRDAQAADRERGIQRELDKVRSAEAEAARAEEEQAREEAEELEQAIALSHELTKASSLTRKREGMPAEPPASPECTAIRVNLPTGGRLQRRFLRTDTVQFLRDFIDIELDAKAVPIERYNLVNSYPRRTFTAEDGQVVLAEAGLVPSAALMLQNLDA